MFVVLKEGMSKFKHEISLMMLENEAQKLAASVNLPDF